MEMKSPTLNYSERISSYSDYWPNQSLTDFFAYFKEVEDATDIDFMHSCGSCIHWFNLPRIGNIFLKMHL